MTLPVREIPKPEIPRRTVPTAVKSYQATSQIYGPRSSLVGNVLTNVKRVTRTIVVTNKEILAVLLLLIFVAGLLLLYFKLVT